MNYDRNTFFSITLEIFHKELRFAMRYADNISIKCRISQSVAKYALRHFMNSVYVVLKSSIFLHPMRIRVRIGPPHPLVCRKRRQHGDPWGSGLE
jgi:hypothetical protein